LNQKRIFINEKTIEQRRDRYETAANPIEAFLREAVAEDSVVTDTVVKEVLYQAYLRFCKKHNLAILSKENLGRILKAGKKLEEGRESSGKKRGTIWKGIKLTSEYDIDARQETLDVSNDNHEPNISCYYCSYGSVENTQYHKIDQSVYVVCYASE
jgi:phage/plasmid-associated DNA primase